MTNANTQPSGDSGDVNPRNPQLPEAADHDLTPDALKPGTDPDLREKDSETEADLAGPALANDDLGEPAAYTIADDETEAEELVNADTTVDDTPDKGDPEDVVIDDEQQLAEAEAVAQSASSPKPVKRKVTTAPVKKDRPTPARDDARASKKGVRARKRTTPAKFVEQSAAELRKVNWPTGDQLRQYFTVVLLFVLFIIAFVGALDLLFGWGLLKLLGAKPK